ncbi:uncharacterized protein LOC114362705 [Ostrinia furnacalis]|uniref:uncharacterized protein LOC114362705 n=1 Tax=Ostrinia furnacalis TaxID=93504 RepID=UPI001039851D|nr:uncharacterized protein LOC114362705 [Ostrinia furnacalis]
MCEPDDPGGGVVPQASNFVTISNNLTDMETDGSLFDTDGSGNNVISKNKRKRSSVQKVCKHCNKKRRRNRKSNLGGTASEFECQCINELATLTQTASTPTDSSQVGDTLVPGQKTSEIPGSSETRTPVGRDLYVATDLAPYTVHVQKEQSSPNENCTLHPVSFGHFLKRNNIKNIVNGSLKRIGRNRISIAFSNFEDANAFLNSNLLKSNTYKAFIPTFNVTRMGVIRGVPVGWSDEDIINNISVPTGCGNIIKVRRLKKKTTSIGKTEFVPIETVVVTFDGQILPKRVFLCYNSLPVDLYIYPTIQCFQCCRYGHVKSQCRSLARCFKCGMGHTGDTCDVDEENISCFLCSGLHMATSRKCPEYDRQRSIKESMAKSCITYSEALKLHPPISKSYADVLVSGRSSQQNPLIPLSPQQPHNNNKQNTLNSSYKKTVFIKPRTPHRPGKGYDRHEHEALTKDYNTPISPSRSILNNDTNSSLSNLPIRDLIIALITSLTHNNILPSNVAIPKNDVLVNNISTVYGEKVPNSAVELQEH